MVNPLAPVFEWWLQFYALLPLAIINYVALNWVILVGLAVVMLLWRAKH